jgi:ATPase subunit of ABC transporter with duplicated ATPase domains
LTIPSFSLIIRTLFTQTNHMSAGNVILRFENVSFSYSDDKPILEEASFSVREDAKITIMGQNGAGKSTLFKLILGASGNDKQAGLKPTGGKVFIRDNSSIAIGLQVMPKEFFDHTILEYFETVFEEKKYNLEKLVKDVLEVVQLSIPLERKVRELSGGQQARLLLALRPHSKTRYPYFSTSLPTTLMRPASSTSQDFS